VAGGSEEEEDVEEDLGIEDVEPVVDRVVPVVWGEAGDEMPFVWGEEA
jgi:hypothetical protein